MENLTTTADHGKQHTTDADDDEGKILKRLMPNLFLFLYIFDFFGCTQF